MAAELGRTEFWSTNSCKHTKLKGIIKFVWVECYKKANLYQAGNQKNKI